MTDITFEQYFRLQPELIQYLKVLHPEYDITHRDDGRKERDAIRLIVLDNGSSIDNRLEECSMQISILGLPNSRLEQLLALAYTLEEDLQRWALGRNRVKRVETTAILDFYDANGVPGVLLQFEVLATASSTQIITINP